MNIRVEYLCSSAEKGGAKSPVQGFILVEDWGIQGDAHAGPGSRQVSIILSETLKEMKSPPAPGAFGENIVLSGLKPGTAVPGNILRFSGGAELRLTMVGKKCHDRCAIFEKLGFCSMADEGLFAEVVKGGKLNRGESVEIK